VYRVLTPSCVFRDLLGWFTQAPMCFMRRPELQVLLRPRYHLTCFLLFCSFVGFCAIGFAAPERALPANGTENQACPRSAEGSRILEPANLRSENGVLRVALTFRGEREPNGQLRFCYMYKEKVQSPTLRVHPGDTIILTLTNDAKITAQHPLGASLANGMSMKQDSADACRGGVRNEASTNIHFHGMVLPPTCHQDETIKTWIAPGSAPFEYRIQIPRDEPPGLYWYHPHPHGFSEEQVLGGASGALIVEGIEKFSRAVSRLPERVLIIRDQSMATVALPSAADPNRPTKDLSVNYVPILYPKLTPSILEVRPQEKEFWRVLNASADTFLDIALVSDGNPQLLALVAMDGVPLGYDERVVRDSLPSETHILLPPAGRAEFIVTTPSLGSEYRLITRAVPRGPLFDPDSRQGGQVSGQPDQDDNDPERPLAIVRSSASAPPGVMLPASPRELETSSVASLASTRPVRIRKFYFSEELVDPSNPRGPTRFYITEEGHAPKLFNPDDPPDVVVHQGDVEDWIIENRSTEPHTFHIHQLHFLVISRYGGPYEEVTLRDTVNIAYWNGLTHPYPNVRLRMDFRSPTIIGTFPFHCHILQHEDGGMMGLIRVEPAVPKN
jgi:FtsP/CotA-like multicopper oxidase with cupredoxin domain